MVKKIIMFIIGVIISAYSVMFIIIYFNILNMGYSLIDYMKYIIKKPECIIIILGILLICLSLRKEKYEIRI